MLEASGQAVGRLVAEVAHSHGLVRPPIIAVGGGAGGLGRDVAARLGVPCTVPPGAEVISSIGDALSLVRAARERTIVDPTAADIDQLVAEVEEEAVRVGAGPATLDVRVEYVADRHALRAVATGAVGLESGARPGRSPVSAEVIDARATELGAERPTPVGGFWVARRDAHVVVFDRFGDVIIDTPGEVIAASAGRPPNRDDVAAAVDRHARHLGPIKVSASVWVVRGVRVTELGSGELVDAALSLAGDDSEAAIVVGRG